MAELLAQTIAVVRSMKVIGHVEEHCRVHRCWLMGAEGNAVHEIACGAGYNIRRLLLRITFLHAWRIAILERNGLCSCPVDDRMLQSGDFSGGLDNEQTARFYTPACGERVRKVAGRPGADAVHAGGRLYESICFKHQPARTRDSRCVRIVAHMILAGPTLVLFAS